ncbi:MAG: NADH-quinone oxidoreductase subunit NuoK [Cyclobacteriaceae bacterium]|jgi:NADH:ubiquinone oxidoreductase subunit K|nr:NADH-quinone oxidoreductase subunit NuoK [Flammeovirgaceae bacterium]
MSPVLLYLSFLLFALGVSVVLTKRNAIVVLLGIELILSAAILNAIHFNQQFPDRMDGQLFALFIIVIAVCEAVVGMSIIIRVYRYYQTAVPDQINELNER